MSNDTIIESKLSDLLVFTDELEQVINLSFEEYSKDFRNVRASERSLLLMVEYATDIIAHILVLRGLTPPSSYRDAFVRAGKESILTTELSEGLAELASLRNRLIHEYTKDYDQRRAYESLRPAPEYFRAFSRAITAL